MCSNKRFRAWGKRSIEKVWKNSSAINTRRYANSNLHIFMYAERVASGWSGEKVRWSIITCLKFITWRARDKALLRAHMYASDVFWTWLCLAPRRFEWCELTHKHNVILFGVLNITYYIIIWNGEHKMKHVIQIVFIFFFLFTQTSLPFSSSVSPTPSVTLRDKRQHLSSDLNRGVFLICIFLLSFLNHNHHQHQIDIIIIKSGII